MAKKSRKLFVLTPVGSWLNLDKMETLKDKLPEEKIIEENLEYYAATKEELRPVTVMVESDELKEIKKEISSKTGKPYTLDGVLLVDPMGTVPKPMVMFIEKTEENGKHED